MRYPRWARPIFFAYALLLLGATHWPKLAIDVGPVPRPDIFMHIGAFAIWTVLFARCGFFAPWGSGRNLLVAGVVAAVYSAVDESTQGIPWINRQSRLDDGVANIGGVAVGVIGAALLAHLRPPNNRDRTNAPEDFSIEKHAREEPSGPNGR